MLKRKTMYITVLTGITGILALSACGTPAGASRSSTQTSTVSVIETEEGFEDLADWRGGHPLSEEELDELWAGMFDPDTVRVIVDGEDIEMPTPFINRADGFIMLPVAHIAEVLGYEVAVDDGEVRLGNAITFTVGTDSYLVGRMAPIELGAVPEELDGVVFVPWVFFGAVVPETAFVMDGNIHITSGEIGEWVDNGAIEDVPELLEETDAG